MQFLLSLRLSILVSYIYLKYGIPVHYDRHMAAFCQVFLASVRAWMLGQYIKSGQLSQLGLNAFPCLPVRQGCDAMWHLSHPHHLRCFEFCLVWNYCMLPRRCLGGQAVWIKVFQKLKSETRLTGVSRTTGQRLFKIDVCLYFWAV